jgi:hypothetical protein
MHREVRRHPVAAANLCQARIRPMPQSGTRFSLDASDGESQQATHETTPCSSSSGRISRVSRRVRRSTSPTPPKRSSGNQRCRTPLSSRLPGRLDLGRRPLHRRDVIHQLRDDLPRRPLPSCQRGKWERKMRQPRTPCEKRDPGPGIFGESARLITAHTGVPECCRYLGR